MYFLVLIYTNSAKIILKEKRSSFIWGKFENHWDLLLTDKAKRREKETQTHHSQLFIIKTHILHQTKHQLQRNINRQVNFWISVSWMGPLNDENKLQVDEENNKN